jgi:CBS domain-containing protein
MTVGQIMTAYPEALGPDDTIQKAAKLMRDHDYGVIPLIDADSSLIGIVTDRDIVVKAVAGGHGLDTPLSECMTPDPDSVPKDIPIEQALHVMNTRQIRRLPVVEFGRLIGMISLGDIAKSRTPGAETLKTLESVSASGGENRPGAGLPES